MRQTGRLWLAGLALAAAAGTTGCTPAVQSDGATTDVRVWSNVTASEAFLTDAFEDPVEVVEQVPPNTTAPVTVPRAPSRPENPRETISRLQQDLQRLQKQLSRMQQEMDRLRRQLK